MKKATENPGVAKLPGSEIDIINVAPKTDMFFAGLVSRAAGLNVIEARS